MEWNLMQLTLDGFHADEVGEPDTFRVLPASGLLLHVETGLIGRAGYEGRFLPLPFGTCRAVGCTSRGKLRQGSKRKAPALTCFRHRSLRIERINVFDWEAYAAFPE